MRGGAGKVWVAAGKRPPVRAGWLCWGAFRAGLAAGVRSRVPEYSPVKAFVPVDLVSILLFRKMVMLGLGRRVQIAHFKLSLR